MKKLTILIFILVSICSCKKDDSNIQSCWTCSFFYPSGSPNPLPVPSDTTLCGEPSLFIHDANGVTLNYTCTPH